MNDEQYMKLAIELAKKGIGYTNPNPLVGAVIVKNDEIIGQGYHERYGELHAERNALASCTASPEGATLYVTLEPCCHYGKTPPCTEAIIEAKIRRVVVAVTDPNPLVDKNGIQILREHGITVDTGVLEQEAYELNRIFFHYIVNRTPYVLMKYAMTLDGKIATRTGASKWISCEASRNHVQLLRKQYHSIMVGVQTVITDDPFLTCRIPNGVNPIRIICDTNLRIPLECNILKTAKDVPTYIATSSEDLHKRERITSMGAHILSISLLGEHIDLQSLLIQLGSLGIDSILLEGGPTLNESFLSNNLVDDIYIYLAPKMFGGKDAKSPVEGIGISTPDQAFSFEHLSTISLGDDILLNYRKK